MKPLSRFIIVSGSLICLLLPKKIAQACGFFTEPAEYRFWLLQPDLANIDDLTPYFTAIYNPGDEQLDAASEGVRNTNIDEWFEQTNKSVSKEDINKIIYNTSPKNFAGSIDSLKTSNTFIRFLAQPGHKELLSYLVLSKKTETIATNSDPWQERPANDPLIERVITEADSLYKSAQLAFVQLRTAYQLLRLYRYNKNRKAVPPAYDARIEPVATKSWIKTAALYEKAGCVDGPESDYLYSKVFDMGGYRRSYCVRRFSYKNLEKILSLARNAHERMVMQTMYTLNNRGRSLQQIKQIYATEPSYHELPFLLLREINKIEDWLVTGKVTEYSSALREYEAGPHYNYWQDKQYAKEVQGFIKAMIHDGKTKDPALLHVLAAHLSLIIEDYPACSQHLATAAKFANNPANVQVQIKVTDLLLYTLTHKKFDSAAEEKLMAIVGLSDKNIPVQDPGMLKDQLTLFIAKKLIVRGEITVGAMLLAQTRRAYGDLIPVESYKHIYIELEEKATASHYDSILAILDKNNKTGFEKYLAMAPVSSPNYFLDRAYFRYPDNNSTEPAWNRNRLLDGKASWYIRQDSLQQALQTLLQIPDSMWNQFPYASYINTDPFVVNVANGHRNDRHESVCNKVDVVKEMIRLQKIADEDPSKAALCYLQLGNAQYNLTWHGKNWLMVKQWWSSTEMENEVVRSTFNDMYYGCTRARDYYLKALQLAKDKKIASLACLMAGKCMENFQAFKLHAYYKKSRTKNPYLTLMKQKGFEADLYNELVRECATYDYFRNEVRRLQP